MSLRRTASAFPEDAFGNALGSYLVGQMTPKEKEPATIFNGKNRKLTYVDGPLPDLEGKVLLASAGDYNTMSDVPLLGGRFGVEGNPEEGGFFNLDGGGFDLDPNLTKQMKEMDGVFDNLQKSLSVDQMGQPLHGPSHYDAVAQFGKIMSETGDDSFLTTAGKIWDWATYTVPDAQQHLAATYGVNPELARLDQIASSPIGAAFWLGAKLSGASPEAQQVWLDVGTIADSAAMFRAGTLGGAPAFTGARGIPELVDNIGSPRSAAEFERLKQFYRTEDRIGFNYTQPTGIWGMDGKGLQSYFKDLGFNSVYTQDRPNSTSQVYTLENHPTIKTFQFTPDGKGNVHGGDYYKFEMHSGDQIKIIDPKLYRPGTIRSNQTFFDAHGNQVFRSNSQWSYESN